MWAFQFCLWGGWKGYPHSLERAGFRHSSTWFLRIAGVDMVNGVFQSSFRQHNQHPELTSRVSGCLGVCILWSVLQPTVSSKPWTPSQHLHLRMVLVPALRTWLWISVCFYCKPLAFANLNFVWDKPNQVSLVSQWGTWFTCWPVLITLLYSLRWKVIRKALRQSGDAVLYMKQLSRTNFSG